MLMPTIMVNSVLALIFESNLVRADRRRDDRGAGPAYRTMDGCLLHYWLGRKKNRQG